MQGDGEVSFCGAIEMTGFAELKCACPQATAQPRSAHASVVQCQVTDTLQQNAQQEGCCISIPNAASSMHVHSAWRERICTNVFVAVRGIRKHKLINQYSYAPTPDLQTPGAGARSCAGAWRNT